MNAKIGKTNIAACSSSWISTHGLCLELTDWKVNRSSATKNVHRDCFVNGEQRSKREFDKYGRFVGGGEFMLLWNCLNELKTYTMNSVLYHIIHPHIRTR